MIEETAEAPAHSGGSWPQRNSQEIAKANAHGRLLRGAFTSQSNYDEFCLLASQLSLSLNDRVSRIPPWGQSCHQQGITESIGLDGKAKINNKPWQPTTPSLPPQFRTTIKLFQEAIQNRNSLQQKREFLKTIICHEFASSAKTAIDLRKQSQVFTDRFHSNLVPRPVENQLSLASLQKEFSDKGKDFPSDYILDFKLLKTCFGHDDGERQDDPGTYIYNIVFDKSGQLLFSADDQGLIKVWSKNTGLALHSFKGHTSYIQQLLVAEGNKYLISSGLDGIRIWSLQSFQCVGVFALDNTVINMNTYFSEKDGLIIFVSDSEYLYIVEENIFKRGNGAKICLSSIIRKAKLPKDQQSEVVQITANVQGHLLIGLSTGEILLLHREVLDNCEEFKYVRINEHASKCFQFVWTKSGRSFISCSMDGTCRVWDFSLTCYSQKSLKSVAQLRMVRHDRRKMRKTVMCNSGAWTCHQNYIIACFSEINNPDQDQKLGGEIIIYDYRNKAVLHQVRHKLFYKLNSVGPMEPHPVFQNIAMFCEANGRIILIDIIKCQLLNVMQERCYHLQDPNSFLDPLEAKFSPDGTVLAVSTEYGNITLYGCGSRLLFFHCPTQQFFRTDRELFAVNEDMIPISLSADIDVNTLDRYPICTMKNLAHDMEYFNDLTQLAKGNFFSEELCSEPMMANPNKFNPEWQAVIERQTRENLSRQDALRPFYQTMQTNVNISTEMKNQHAYLMNAYKQKLEQKLFEFNNLSQTLQKPVIKVGEPRRIIKKNKRLRSHKDSNSAGSSVVRYNQDLSQDSLVQNQERQSNSYRDESEPSFANESDSEQVIPHPRRRRGRLTLQSDSEEQQVRRSRRPPAQRIQQLDEGFQEIQQRRNRRRRVEPLGQQQNVQGNLPRQRGIMQEIAPPCKCGRCLKGVVEQICQKCLGRGYCLGCKPFRGKDDLGKFKCFGCLFNKISYHQDVENINRTHLNQTRRNPYVYVPQIDDQVYFYPLGYQEFLIKFHDTLNPKATLIFDNFQLLAMDDIRESQDKITCRVIDIEYLFPIIPKRKTLKSKITTDPISEINLVVELMTSQGMTFQVFYISEQVDFLVRKEVVDELVRNSFAKKITLFEMFTNKNGEELQITEMNLPEKAFAWKSINVSPVESRLVLRNGQRKGQNSEYRINIWDVSPQTAKIPFRSIGKEEVERILSLMSDLNTSSPELFQFFSEDVDINLYPVYLQQVEVPMSIRIITSRLENGYYPSEKSLLFDIKLIAQDSTLFNGQGHHVTLLAEELVDQLTRIVQIKSIRPPLMAGSEPNILHEMVAESLKIHLPQSVQAAAHTDQSRQYPQVQLHPVRSRSSRSNNTQYPLLRRQSRATRNQGVRYTEMEVGEQHHESVGNTVRRSTRRRLGPDQLG